MKTTVVKNSETRVVRDDTKTSQTRQRYPTSSSRFDSIVNYSLSQSATSPPTPVIHPSPAGGYTSLLDGLLSHRSSSSERSGSRQRRVSGHSEVFDNPIYLPQAVSASGVGGEGTIPHTNSHTEFQDMSYLQDELASTKIVMAQMTAKYSQDMWEKERLLAEAQDTIQKLESKVDLLQQKITHEKIELDSTTRLLQTRLDNKEALILQLQGDLLRKATLEAESKTTTQSLSRENNNSSSIASNQELERIRRERDAAYHEQMSLEMKIQTYQFQISDVTQKNEHLSQLLEEQVKKCADIVHEVSSHTNEFKVLQQRTTLLERERANLENELFASTTQTQSLLSEKAEWNKKYTTLSQEMEKLRSESQTRIDSEVSLVAKYRAEIEILKKQQAKAKDIKQSEYKEEREALKTEINVLKTQSEAIQKEMKVCKISLEEMIEQHEKSSRLVKKLNQFIVDMYSDALQNVVTEEGYSRKEIESRSEVSILKAVHAIELHHLKSRCDHVQSQYYSLHLQYVETQSNYKLLKQQQQQQQQQTPNNDPQLINQVAALMNERNNLQLQLDTCKETLQNQLSSHKREKEELQHQLKLSSSNVDSLQHQLSFQTKERDALLQQLAYNKETLQTQLALISKERTSLLQQGQNLLNTSSSNTRSNSDYESLHIHIASLTKERDGLLQQLMTAQAEAHEHGGQETFDTLTDKMQTLILNASKTMKSAIYQKLCQLFVLLDVRTPMLTGGHCENCQALQMEVSRNQSEITQLQSRLSEAHTKSTIIQSSESVLSSLTLNSALQDSGMKAKAFERLVSELRFNEALVHSLKLELKTAKAGNASVNASRLESPHLSPVRPQK